MSGNLDVPPVVPADGRVEDGDADLAALAGVRPAATRPAMPDPRAALDDERAVHVRAILALRDLRATDAREDLRRVRGDDPDPTIRELAGDALGHSRTREDPAPSPG